MRRATQTGPAEPCVSQISIHALLAESDHAQRIAPTHAKNFYPRSPCGERLPRSRSGSSLHGYFYPRSPCGERLYNVDGYFVLILFLSTLSLRRATPQRRAPPKQPGNFYPRSPCGERLLGAKRRPCMGRISIHALLAESDASRFHLRATFSISIHALLAESDKRRMLLQAQAPRNFYPRSPCGERPLQNVMYSSTQLIFLSTLSLRRATRKPTAIANTPKFLSTLSLRRATGGALSRCDSVLHISIHALLAESDQKPL